MFAFRYPLGIKPGIEKQKKNSTLEQQTLQWSNALHKESRICDLTLGSVLSSALVELQVVQLTCIFS